MLSDVLHKLSSTISNQWTWWGNVNNEKDELTRAVLTISIVLLSIFFYLWTFLKSRNQISAPLPPGPCGLPIVGYLPFLDTNLHQQFAELAHQYGPIYQLWFGKKLCVMLSSPSLAKEVTRDLDTVFANRDPHIAALAATYGGFDIAFAPYGPYWRTMRKVFVREMLSNTSLEDTYSLRRGEVKKTIRELHSKIGTAVEISKITFLTEFNLVMSMLWGDTVDSKRADSVGTEFRAVISKIVELIAKPNMSDFFPILARFDVQGVEREMKRLVQGVDRIFDPLLESRTRMSRGEGGQENGMKSKGKKDFIQILLELKEREDAAIPITLQQIKALLLDIVTAGTDTTATMVEWVMAELLHKPEILSTISNQWTWWWDVIDEKDELARAVLTISTVLLSMFFYLWTFLKSRNQISAPMPPGPCGLPIVGYLPFLGTNLHHQFAELANQYGPIYKLWFGKKMCVVLSSPSLAKEVVRDLDTVFANRDPPIAVLACTYGGIDIAWAPYGPYWRTMRKVFVREMLSNTSLEDTCSLRRDEVKKTIRDLHSKIGTAVEISEITFLTEFNVVMSMLWGGTVDSQRADSVGTEFRAVTSKIIELAAKPNVSDFFPILARFDVQGVEREMKRLLQWVDLIFDPLLESGMSRREGGQENGMKSKGKKDFIQILLELKEREDAAIPITLQQIKAMLMDIVVGGTDTAATTVEWVMAELLHKPEVMKKVQEELSDIVGLNNVVEESHMPKLHYLDAVLKETFRLHPALPLLVPKRPNQSSIVGGYTIPKDTRVFLNIWAIHRDPEAWDDPSEFKPERFLSDAREWDYNGNNFQFLPFGSGRRICAGLPLAEKMVMYVLASILHSFNWKVPEGEEIDLSEKFGIVMKKSKPLIAIPTQRLSSLKLYA
ncbi:hypothetical protein RHMOL_Rhmol07G0120700 [Rhododendron molle]|uniref:Uncharacterized protein n=1 Tax=Rhododendron molle TaxID=49168 RepID=A0ACC0MZN4_RHOML|nr:hypothetical protein RHMOL_Rhmol07G0120700 [Rhododendron molle]